jgi:lipopolysaccharide export LptBFGC system permease protein LptF
VGEYLLNLTPSMIYQITPLSVLIAVLVTFGMFNRSSELIAMKATGISIYRLVIPVLVISAVLACGLFAFDQYYLPQANRKQEALRNIIKGKPAQTTLNPDQKWIFGQQIRASRTGLLLPVLRSRSECLRQHQPL